MWDKLRFINITTNSDHLKSYEHVNARASTIVDILPLISMIQSIPSWVKHDKICLSYEVASGSEITPCNKIDEPLFLHGNTWYEAVWSRKIHVQIMRFTCCLNMAFTWKSLNWALICIHDVTLESVTAVTDHFADAFVRENVARVYMTL